MDAVDTRTRRISFGLWLWGGAALLAVAAAPARADPPEDAAAAQAGAAGEEHTTYTFVDEAVLGASAQPSGEILMVRRRGQHESLVRMRESFVRELLESVEAL